MPWMRSRRQMSMLRQLLDAVCLVPPGLMNVDKQTVSSQELCGY
jgi:hypothetical protein